jgi:hypothetical protein
LEHHHCGLLLQPGTGWGTSRSSDLIAGDNQLHPTVLLPAWICVIGCHRLAFAESTGANGGGVHPMLREEIANRIGPVLRQEGEAALGDEIHAV